MGIVFADALPPSESPSPAVPSAVAAAAALLVRACFEACFTRGMVASFVVVKGSCAVRLEMQPSASGSPLREGFFELQLVGQKRGWILRQQRCPNVSRARRPHETLTHFCLGQAETRSTAAAPGRL